MTVKITKEAKKWLTVAQMPIVRQIIASLKEDEITAADAAKQTASIIFGYSEGVKIFEATAEIAGNQRINNYWVSILKDIVCTIPLISISLIVTLLFFTYILMVR